MTSAPPLRLVLALAALASLGACHRTHHAWRWADQTWDGAQGPPPTAIAKLNCPDQQGELTRDWASDDGRGCSYRNDRGETVSLSLTALDGKTPQVALAPTEATLRDDLPDVAAAPQPPTPSQPPAAPGDSDGQDGGGDHAHVDVPFVHVDADDDHAHVKVFGMTIDADNHNAKMHSAWGGNSTVIKAGPQGAEIRVAKQGGPGVEMVYLLASDHPGSDGLRTVGYQARGPKGGPLVVAVFKSRAAHEHDHGFRDRDIDQLLALNAHP